MTLLGRFTTIVKSKLNSLLNRAENPEEQLDYSYEKMRDKLQDVKRNVSEVTKQKVMLEKRKQNLVEEIEKHNDQAREAVRQDRDDLARRALEKKQTKMDRVETLTDQIADLEQTEQDLISQKDKLQSKIQEFKTKKEMKKAKYNAAEAQVSVQENLNSLDGEGVGQAIEDMEDDIEEMEARSEAMNELEEEGVIESPLDDTSDLESELDELSTESDIDTELDNLKQEEEGETGNKTSEEIKAELDADDEKDLNVEEVNNDN